MSDARRQLEQDGRNVIAVLPFVEHAQTGIPEGADLSGPRPDLLVADDHDEIAIRHGADHEARSTRRVGRAERSQSPPRRASMNFAALMSSAACSPRA